MQRKLNIKVALVSLGIIFLFGAALHAMHSYQVVRNADNLLRQADRALEKKQIAQALRYFNHYLSYRPDDIEAMTRYGLLLEKNPQNPGDLVHANSTLIKILRAEPGRKEVRFRLVHCLIRLKLYLEAIAQAENLLPDWDNKGEMEHIIGWCFEAQTQYEKAALWFRKAIGQDPHRLESFTLLAEVLQVRLNDGDQAAEVMNNLVTSNADSFQAYLSRFRFLLKRHSTAEAEMDLQQALQLAPKEPAVLLAAADWAQAQGKAAQARTHLALGLELHPKEETLYKALAGLEITSGNRDKAEEILRRGLKELPQSWDLQVLLTDLLIDKGLLAEADQQLADLKRTGPVSPLTDYFQARLRIQHGRWSEAIPLLERVQAELVPSSEWLSRTYALLGLCYQQIGDTELQLAAFRRAVHLEPGWMLARFGLGSALLVQGRLEEALAEFQQVAKNPDPPAAVWTELARCLVLRNLRLPADQRNWAEIDPILNQAEKVQPAALEIPILQAEILVAQKKYPEAQKLLEKAGTSFPKNVALQCALADVARRQNDFDRARTLLDEAQKAFGDSLELRQARLRLWGQQSSQVRPALATLAENLQALPAETRSRFLRELAETAQKQGDSASAEQFWLRLAQEQPRDARVRFQLLELDLQANKFESARQWLEELGKVEGKKGTFWRYGTAALLLAEFPGQPQKRELARNHLIEAQRQKRDWARIPLLLARIDELEGKTEQAIPHYQAAFDLGERSPRLVYRLVQLHQERRNFTAAEELLRQAEQQYLLPPELARLGAETALANNNLVRALALAKLAVPTDSRDYRDYLWLARIHQAANQPAQAEAFLRQAITIAAHTPDTWVALVNHLVSTGQSSATQVVLDQAKEKIAPDRLPLTLARCLDVLGQTEQAEHYFHQALAARPTDFIILASAADFCRRSDQPQKAQTFLKKLLQPECAAPAEILARARRDLALILASKSHQEALDLIDLNLKQRGPNLADERAHALVLGYSPNKKTQDKALQMFEITLSRQPGTPDELFQFAKLCEAADNQARSRTLFLDLVTNYPDNPQFLAQYIRSQIQTGDLKDALTYFHKLQQREPNSPRTLELKKLLLNS